jgi:hypothetical protein
MEDDIYRAPTLVACIHLFVHGYPVLQRRSVFFSCVEDDIYLAPTLVVCIHLFVDGYPET